MSKNEEIGDIEFLTEWFNRTDNRAKWELGEILPPKVLKLDDNLEKILKQRQQQRETKK